MIRVLGVASEIFPLVKTGGLADVVGALSQKLGASGHDVCLFLPKYRAIEAAALQGGIAVPLSVPVGPRKIDVNLRYMQWRSVSVYFIDYPPFYDRDGLYGADGKDHPDNDARFALYARAALEGAKAVGFKPDVVHAHDWQAGLAPVYLRTMYAGHPTLGDAATVFTIHNLAYQGLFEPDWLPRLDLPWDLLGVEAMEFYGRISFLKAGINFSDEITTVSPTYAREIQTPAFGFGFDGILRRRAANLSGILNGIDVVEWNPETDPNLPQPYDRDDLSGKRAAKAAVLATYGLPADDAALERPLVGMISRMVDQKGLDLIAAIAPELPRLDASFVVLGTGEPQYQDLWRTLAAAHPDRIGARIGFDEALAHLIEGGADLFLMPSQFEPCGLNQMYSLRYGTVPLVRAVGGLADTVVDCRPGARSATGFVFDDYTPEALLDTLNRALATFHDRRRWRALQRAGMAREYSWDRSAREYVNIYRRAVARRARHGASGG